MKNWALLGISLGLILTSCLNKEVNQPKPRGYFKIEFPVKAYQQFDGERYSFKYPKYARLQKDMDSNAQPNWFNMNFDGFNGKIHISYYPIQSVEQFNELTEDARKLVYKHTIKASAIDQIAIRIPEHQMYGFMYQIDGNAASWVQFFLTDSSKNYLRGALYFREKPQLDSIRPVVNFIKQDIDTLIQTLQWKN